MFKGTPRSSSPISYNDDRSHGDERAKYPLLSKFKDNDILCQTGDSTRSLLEPIYKMDESSIVNDDNRLDCSSIENKSEDVSR